MKPAQDKALLKNLFNALPEVAEGGVDVSAFYVNRSPDDEHDSVANLKQLIEWSPHDGDTYLFSGLRGAGKTTELNRLVTELRDDRIAAFYCDASAYLNLNDPALSLPELLMAALAGLSDAVRKEFGKDFLEDTIWARTKRLLNSEVVLKPTISAGLGAGEVDIEASLIENPDFRKQLIDFARHSADFYVEANKFASDVARLVKTRKGCDKIVLVVDSLERLSAPTGEEKRLFDSLKNIFFNEPARLRFAGFSVVYSAPPYLHAVLPNVGSGFSRCISLPNFKVIKRPESADTPPTPNPDGIQRMVRLLEQRFADWQNAVSKPVVEHLAWMSGGNVRRFFSLLRSLASKASLGQAALPIADTNDGPVLSAISEAAQPLQWLTGPDHQWLKHFMKSSENAAVHIQNLEQDLPSIIRLFDHSLVLDYQNGSVWYQVPQMVREHVKNRHQT